MAFDKVIDSALLDAGMTATANAIREKTGGTTSIKWDAANGFKAAVEEIDERGVVLPELGDTAAQPTDMAYGKVLYDDEGNPVTGTLHEAKTFQDKFFGHSDFSFGGIPGGTTFSVAGVTKGTGIIRPGAGVGVRNAPTDFFGDAMPEHVDKGVKFTSKAGLLVEGTREETGVTLPELGETAAQPSDIAYGKVLYDDDGNPVSGTLAEITSGAALSASDNATVAGSASTGIRIKAQRSDGSDYILRSGAYLMAAAPANQFGDAAAADVAKGKTFTSAEGLLVEGTHECETGLQLAPLANPASAADIVSGKALYDSDGNVIPGSLYEVLEGKTIAATEFVRLLEDGNGDINTWATQNTGDAVVRNNAIFRTVAPASAFGDATPDQVVKGATFTSAAGLLVEGTHECEGGVTLPELTNPATASDLALDKQLIDGSGNILTGTLPESGVDTNVMATGAAFWGNSLENTQFSLSGVYSKGNIGSDTFRGFICRPGTNFVLRNIPTSLFGDATADQVAKGATFTSAAGLLVEGTHECEKGVQMRVEGDTLYITGDVSVENETLIL